MKDLQKYDQNPRLNKLTIADLLVKPMHRITRYPLLFKRLLSHLTVDTPAHTILQSLVQFVEDKIADVNEIVRVKESQHRIKIIDENMEFGGIEKFKICNGRRELLSEKNLTYYKKGVKEGQEVTLMLFSDLLIIAKMKRPDFYMMFKAPIPLEEAVFLDKPDTTSNSIVAFITSSSEARIPNHPYAARDTYIADTQQD